MKQILIASCIFFYITCSTRAHPQPVININLTGGDGTFSLPPKQVTIKLTISSGPTPHEELYKDSELSRIMQYIVDFYNKSAISPFMQDILYYDPNSEKDQVDDPVQYCRENIYKVLNATGPSDNECDPKYHCDYQANRFPAFLVDVTCQKSFCGVSQDTLTINRCSLYRNSVPYLIYHPAGTYTQVKQNGYPVTGGVWYRSRKMIVTDCVCSNN